MSNSRYLMEKDPRRKAFLKNQNETKHSLISAVAAFFAVQEHLQHFNEILSLDEWKEFLPAVSFITVRRHHSNLEPFLDDLSLSDQANLKHQAEVIPSSAFSFLPYWEKVYPKLKAIPESWPLRKLRMLSWLKTNRGVLPYLLHNILFSLLLDADKHVTVVGEVPSRSELLPDLVDRYIILEGFNHSRSKIDCLRNEIYQEVMKSLIAKDLEENHIFSLTAPTGCGKTLTVLSAALKLRKRIQEIQGYIPRIIYALPFLSIIDQNTDVFLRVLNKSLGREPSTDLLLVHHHLAEIAYKTEESEFETAESEILVEGWDSEIVVTTFVQFFHTLFSHRNRAIRKLHKIAGSIVILDEIQSLPHKYWLLFRKTAEAMAKYLNTHFILVTATQPAIFDHPAELLPGKDKYFKELSRVTLQNKMENRIDIPTFTESILNTLNKNPKNTLVVLNTIRAAKETYEALKDVLARKGFETYFLSSHVVPKQRLQRIRQIKDSPNLKIVVSTQLVEAGVDIDLDWVVRDLGPMDAINQVAGRANRNFKEAQGLVDVVSLQDQNSRPFYSYIYDPLLLEFTKEALAGKTTISLVSFSFRKIERYFFGHAKIHIQKCCTN